MPVLNGRLDAALLAPVPGGRLRIDAAASWIRLVADVKARTGYLLAPTSSADTYRPYDVQVSTFRARYTTDRVTGVDPRTWNGQVWWRLPGVAAAAVPGTSNHGLGIAVDVKDMGAASGAKYRALTPIAHEHGWDNNEGASISEPWHWVYKPNNDQHNAPAQEDDMPTLEEIDRVVRVAVADEVAKVMRGNEFDLEVTSLPTAIANAVLGAQIERGGIGPAALRDWLADARILAGQAAERAAAAGVDIDYDALAKALIAHIRP